MKRLIVSILAGMVLTGTANAVAKYYGDLEIEQRLSNGSVTLRNHDGNFDEYNLSFSRHYRWWKPFIGFSYSDETYAARFPVHAIRRAMEIGVDYNIGGSKFMVFELSPYLGYVQRVIEYHKGTHSEAITGFRLSTSVGGLSAGFLLDGLMFKANESSRKGFYISFKF